MAFKPISLNNSVFSWLAAALLLLVPVSVFSYFSPGETLNPQCAPSDNGCDIDITTVSITASSSPPANTSAKLYNIGGVLYWNGSTVGGGSGLTSLNGLTAGTQTFVNDTNITIVSTSSTHTLTWSGQLAAGRGGTGLSSVSANQLLIGNSAGTAWTQVSTSSLGIAISDTTGTLSVARGGTGATTLTGLLLGNGTSAFTATTTLSAALIEDAYLRNTGDSISGNLTFSGSAANIALGSNWLSGDGGDEGVVVTGSGNVGIGTSTPDYILDIRDTSVGFVRVSGPINTGGAGPGIKLYEDFVAAVAPGGFDLFVESLANRFDIRSFSNSFTPVERLTIYRDSGNVGIGTTTPGSRLTVNGDTHLGGNVVATGTLAVTGTTTLSNASTTNLTVSTNSYLGTVRSGTWNGTAIAVANGGTGATTLTGLLIGNGTSAFTATTTLSAALIEDAYLRNTGDSISGNLTFSGSSANIVLGSNWLSGDGGDEGIFVDSSGRVGIGTTTSPSTFSVIGDVLIQRSNTDFDWNPISSDVSSALLKVGLDANGNGLVIKGGETGPVNRYFGIYNVYGTALFEVANNGLYFGSQVFSASGVSGGSFLNIDSATDRNVFSTESTSSPAVLIVDDRDDITANNRTTPLLRFSFNDTPILVNSLGGINPFNRWSHRGVSLMTYNATSSQFIENVTALDSGNVGIGTTSPVRRLHSYEGSTSPVARFENTDGYCEIDPTNTALVCVSDKKLKTNVMTLNSGVLEGVLSLNPVNFDWKTQVGEGTDGVRGNRIGFIAQEVEEVFPMLVNTDESGTKNVAYSNFTPLLIKAIQELSGISSSTAPLVDQSGKKTFVGRFFDRMTVWLASSKNGINTFFAKKIFTEQICVKKSDGSHYCVSGDELEDAVGGGNTPTEPPPPPVDEETDVTEEPDNETVVPIEEVDDEVVEVEDTEDVVVDEEVEAPAPDDSEAEVVNEEVNEE